MLPTTNSCTSSVLTLIRLAAVSDSDSDMGLGGRGCAMAHHMADGFAARARADIGLAGQELLDPLGKRRGLLALRARLLGQRLETGLVPVLLKADGGATPR